jgi:hypothetical protein
MLQFEQMKRIQTRQHDSLASLTRQDDSLASLMQFIFATTATAVNPITTAVYRTRDSIRQQQDGSGHKQRKEDSSLLLVV